MEIIFEAIPQFIIQNYVSFMKKSNSKYKVEFLSDSLGYSLQFWSIMKSFITISLGFKSIFGYESFYFLEPKVVKLKVIRKISLSLWYMTILLPRLIIITSSIISIRIRAFDYFQLSIFSVISFLKTLLINFLEKLELDKLEKINKNVNKGIPKIPFQNRILNLGCLLIGVYKNIFIDYKNIYFPGSNYKRHTKFYFYYYASLWIENVILWYLCDFHYLFFYAKFTVSDSMDSIFAFIFFILFILSLIIQVSYEILETKHPIDTSKTNEEKMFDLLQNKYQIYISGCCNLNGFDNKKFSEWLDINFNLNSFCSMIENDQHSEIINFEDMSDIRLVISFETQKNNNEWSLDVENARLLKKKILFIYNSDDDKNNDKRKFQRNERTVVLKELNFFDMEKILKDDYNLLKKNFKGRPFKRLDLKEIILLKHLNIIRDIYFLNKEQKMVLMIKQNEKEVFLSKFDLNNNELTKVYNCSFFVDSVMCVNNSKNQIIIFENINNKFIFYDFDFKLIKVNYSKEKLVRIVVNDKNNEIYSLNSTLKKLIRFNEKIKIVEKLSVNNTVNLKYLDAHVYLLHFIVDTAIHFISIYNTANQKKLKFE
jgi:hypothetical protein